MWTGPVNHLSVQGGMDYDDENTFASVAWDRDPAPESTDQQTVDSSAAATTAGAASTDGGGGATPAASTSRTPRGGAETTTEIVFSEKLQLSVCEPVRELEGTKDSFVSYAVLGETDMAHFTRKQLSTRRRFHDFVFLHDHLGKDFPACVIPPLPGKHRLEYITGDRFSLEFVEKRRADLDRFLQRMSRHPVLARSKLLQAFLESSEWNVVMHQQVTHPPSEEPSSTMLENLSDTFINAFTKVRKPDERFLEMREELDKFEEALGGVDRIEARSKNRTNDLSADYDSLSTAIQSLAHLESGITEPLTRFESSLFEFSNTLRRVAETTIEPFLDHLTSLLAYSASFKAVLKLRDQKQLDFEELSSYLSSSSVERDRLASGMGSGQGIGSYLRSRVDALRGSDNDFGRESRIVKLESKIKELQDAVNAAHETSESFNAAVVREHAIFQQTKKKEMKQLLGAYAEGQINFYRKAIADFETCEPALRAIHS